MKKYIIGFLVGVFCTLLVISFIPIPEYIVHDCAQIKNDRNTPDYIKEHCKVFDYMNEKNTDFDKKKYTIVDKNLNNNV